MKHIEYQIVSAKDPIELTLEVTEYIKRGWTLQGGVTSARINSFPQFYQAMIKKPPKEGALR